MRVYIAGPLTQGDRIKNIRRAIEAGDRIASRGHRVFIPHLYDLWELTHTHPYEFWMKQDITWMRQCEVVVRLSGASEGADREAGLAAQLKMPVFHSVEEFMNSIYWCRTED